MTGNKKGKKGEFEDAAKYMLTVHRNDLYYFGRLLYIGYNYIEIYVTISNLHFKSEVPYNLYIGSYCLVYVGHGEKRWL